VQHPSGTSAATISINFVSEEELTGHRYQVTFEVLGEASGKSLEASKTYTVTDLDLDAEVLSDIPVLNGEGPAFDGIRLEIQDLPESGVDEENTGWTEGDADSEVIITAPLARLDGQEIKFLATAADYRITITEEVVDTSLALFGFEAAPLRFTVENTTQGEPREILFEDFNSDALPNSRRSLFDGVYILEDDGSGTLVPAWKLEFQDGASLPETGDVFTLSTLKPIADDDVFEFMGAIGVAIEDEGEIPGRVQLGQNYPNPFAQTTTIPYRLNEAGDVRLTLHDILGRRVAILEDGPNAARDYRVQWDATNMPSGVYFYRLETGAGTVRKSMLLVK
jgi:hypothetical protein